MTLNHEIKDKIIEKAESFFEHGSHGWDHTLRVHNLAMHIAKSEGGNLDVVELAAYLHDIGRPEENESKGKEDHVQIGAEKAKKILTDFDIDKKIAEDIIHCIFSHSYRRGSVPETLEAKIIFDADKLDGIGAVGVGRLFYFAGEHGGKFHNMDGTDTTEGLEYSKEDTAHREYLVKMQHVLENLYTIEGKMIGKERQDFIQNFFERFLKEVKGEK